MAENPSDKTPPGALRALSNWLRRVAPSPHPDPELAATSEEQYAEIAVNLARDLPRLASLRATLREKMKASPLLDAPRFARNLEAAYRGAWQRWCATRQTRDGS